MAISNKFNSKRLSAWDSDCEDIWVSIDLPGRAVSRGVCLCAVYLQSPLKNTCYKNLCLTVKKYDLPTCIMGDLNLGCIDWSLVNDRFSVYNGTAMAQQLIDFTCLNNFKQYNDIRNSQNKILDLVLVNFPNCTVVPAPDVLSKVDPYHPPIEVTMSFVADATLRSNSNILIPNSEIVPQHFL